MTPTTVNFDILVGNSFPLRLIKRKAIIEPSSLEALQQRLREAGKVYSYFGHASTLPAVNRFLQFDISPIEERPVLTLDSNNLPSLHGNVFHDCWVISPVFKQDNYRPPIGKEAPPEEIQSWDISKISWH